MKKIKTLIGVALLAATVTFTGCSTLQTDITNWLNSPATQAEITAIANAALTFAEQYLLTVLAAPVNGIAPAPLTIDSPQIVTAQATEVAALQKQYPDAPAAALQLKVHDAFVTALAAKYGK